MVTKWEKKVKSGKKWEEMFLGEFRHSVDDRNRLALPKKIRIEISGNTLVLARGFEKCILAYTRSDWERETAKELEAPISDSKGREIKRYLFSGAELVEIDKVGRVLLPQLLKEYAEIGSEAVVIGAGDHFEIWNPRSWKNYLGEREKKIGKT